MGLLMKSGAGVWKGIVAGLSADTQDGDTRPNVAEVEMFIFR